MNYFNIGEVVNRYFIGGKFKNFEDNSDSEEDDNTETDYKGMIGGKVSKKNVPEEKKESLKDSSLIVPKTFINILKQNANIRRRTKFVLEKIKPSSPNVILGTIVTLKDYPQSTNVKELVDFIKTTNSISLISKKSVKADFVMGNSRKNNSTVFRNKNEKWLILLFNIDKSVEYFKENYGEDQVEISSFSENQAVCYMLTGINVFNIVPTKIVNYTAYSFSDSMHDIVKLKNDSFINIKEIGELKIENFTTVYNKVCGMCTDFDD